MQHLCRAVILLSAAVSVQSISYVCTKYYSLFSDSDANEAAVAACPIPHRLSHAMAWRAATRELLVFGGFSALALEEGQSAYTPKYERNDLWAYNTTFDSEDEAVENSVLGWRLLSDDWRQSSAVWTLDCSQYTVVPAPRAYAQLVPETESDSFLLFGGYCGGVFMDDLWRLSFDAKGRVVWKRLEESTGQQPGSVGKMVNGTLWLFGGVSSDMHKMEVGNDEFVVSAAVNNGDDAPSSRTYHRMDYSPSVGALVLFGGKDANANNDLWLYHLSNMSWTLVETSWKPWPRFNHAMAVCKGKSFTDSEQDLLIIAGGEASDSDSSWSDMRAYDFASNTWSLFHDKESGTEERTCADLVCDGNDLWLFGGRSLRTAKVYNDLLWQNVTQPS